MKKTLVKLMQDGSCAWAAREAEEHEVWHFSSEVLHWLLGGHVAFGYGRDRK